MSVLACDDDGEVGSAYHRPMSRALISIDCITFWLAIFSSSFEKWTSLGTMRVSSGDGTSNLSQNTRSSRPGEPGAVAPRLLSRKPAPFAAREATALPAAVDDPATHATAEEPAPAAEATAAMPH